MSAPTDMGGTSTTRRQGNSLMTEFPQLIGALAGGNVEFIEFLIRLKRAARRPKDLQAIAELEALHEESRRL